MLKYKGDGQEFTKENIYYQNSNPMNEYPDKIPVDDEQPEPPEPKTIEDTDNPSDHINF